MRLITSGDFLGKPSNYEAAGFINYLDWRRVGVNSVALTWKRQAEPRHGGKHREHDVAEAAAKGEGPDEDQRQDAKADGQRAGEGMGEGTGHAPLPGPFRRPSFTSRANVAGQPVGAGELQRLRGCGAVDRFGADHGRSIAEQAVNVDQDVKAVFRPTRYLGLLSGWSELPLHNSQRGVRKTHVGEHQFVGYRLARAVFGCGVKESTKRSVSFGIVRLKLNGWLVAAFAILCSHSLALAQSPRQQAQEAAGAATGATSVVKGGQQQLVDRVPGFQTGDPTNLTRHYVQEGAGLEDATFQKLGNTNDGEGGEAASTMIETYTTRPNINVTRTDEFLATSRGVLGNPDLLAGDLFATNQNPACEATHVNSTPFEIKSCDKYGAPEEATCGLGVQVDVLAEKTYACFTETPTYRKTCAETLTARCTQVLSNCKLENGLITTPNPDIQLSYQNFRHRAYLPGDFYGDGCKEIMREVSVQVDDLSKLVTARLSWIKYNDTVSVYVNGNFVWGGPYGSGGREHRLGTWTTGHVDMEGGPISIQGAGDPNGGPVDPLTGIRRHYLGACRDVGGEGVVGVDIRPFMRQGANRIVFRLIVESGAGFTADFQLLNSCCGNWEETWERTCPE